MKKEDYFKYYIQGSDHYLIPKNIFDELYNEMNNWKHEFQQLESNWKGLKKSIKDEIERTNKIIEEDSNMIEINNIRKMLNSDRENWLFKMQELENKNG